MRNNTLNKHEAAVDLIGNDENGIITLLDDECKLLVPTAKNLTYNILKTWTSSPVLVNKIQCDPYTSFTVRHFVCDVTYTTFDFIEKNTTAVSEDITRVSKSALYCLGDSNIFLEKRSKRIGVSEGFTTKTELKTLLSSLNQTVMLLFQNFMLKKIIYVYTLQGLNFIRCIKSNAHRQSNQFDERFIEIQLENTGTTFFIENASDVKKST